MPCRHVFALSVGAVLLLAAVPDTAQACHWWKRHRPVHYAPPPTYCPPAPGPYHHAPPMYHPPGAYYPAPGAPHMAPGAPHMVPGQPYPAAPSAPATASTVAAKDNSFDPPTLTVAPGTTVRWENKGAHPHTVTDRGGKFDSGDIAPGSSYTTTFQTPGTYRYYCKHHKGMEGTIVVGEPKKMPGAGGGGTKGPAY